MHDVKKIYSAVKKKQNKTTCAIFSSPIFHGCVNEHLADRTPSPTFSTADSDITELADERQSEMDDFMDDEAFVDDTSSDAGTEEGSDIFSDGHDPFYDRSPWFTLVGRLVRGERLREGESRQLCIYRSDKSRHIKKRVSSA